MLLRIPGLVLALFAAACGHPAPSSPTDDALAADAATADVAGDTMDASADALVLDAPVTQDGPSDAAMLDAEVDATPDAIADASLDAPASDAPVGCGVLPDDPADVFVDARSTAAMQVGTASCPFLTISAALALSPPTAPRRVHVKGGVPAVDYIEPGLLALPPQLTLEGDGADRVTVGGVGGGGSCAIVVSPSCTVSLAGGATLRDLTVTSATGSAIEVKAGTGPARIERVIATRAKQIGFAIRADAVLDHASALDNDGDGLDARTATVTVRDSEFRLNTGHGLDIDTGATLTLTGATIHNNGGRGILLHNGTQFAPLAHAITGADIQQNLFAGIDVASNASLTLRGTTMFQNEFGVLYQVGPSNTLDVGTSAAPGNNVFAGATPVNGNARAGLCMQSTRATPTQLVEGNRWRACPPAQKKITGPFCSSNNGYSDIAYVPAVATSGPPVVAPAACTVGP